MKYVFFGLLMALVPSAFAQDSKPMVVVINIDQVYVASDVGQNLGKKMQEFTKAAQEEGKPLAAKQQALREKAKTAETLSPEAIAQLQRGLKDVGIEIDRFNEDKKRQAQVMQDEGLESIEVKLKPVLEILAQENGWDVLLNKVPSVVIMAGPAADVTQKVIERLNKETAGK